jgi:hypothetical protein
MKVLTLFHVLFLILLTACETEPVQTRTTDEILLFHPLVIEKGDSALLPWYDPDPGTSYDHILKLVWDFWDTMRMDINGIPYYMNHQVWRDGVNDPRGIGGDQLAMALSSWNLYYPYSGNERVLQNMKFIAGYYLTHSLSPPDAAWPDIPFPYNTLIYSGCYDGDMVIGKDYTQPDKAGSFGYELVKLYKMTNRVSYPNVTDDRYLDAAVNIASTLAKHTEEGSGYASPMPFKVNAVTGEVGMLIIDRGENRVHVPSEYTTNWSGTMDLFLSLIELDAGDTALYRIAFNKLLTWMKTYPMNNNNWGPFFEDVPGYSSTQINAVTFAQFIMNHRELFPDWKNDVARIFKWVYRELGNEEWEKYGVTAVNEQTAYRVPGNSHTSRQASAEIQYAALTGDHANIPGNIRQLNWATYMVSDQGVNQYPRDDPWLTDGYGDYVRHFLRAMKYWPELAPGGQDHLLSSTSEVQFIRYEHNRDRPVRKKAPKEQTGKEVIRYRTYDDVSEEIFRITTKPADVLINSIPVPETSGGSEGWSWKPLDEGGILTIRHRSGNDIQIFI